MGTRLRVTAKARDKRKVKVETIHEPLNSRGGVASEDLNELRTDQVTSGKCSILVELLDRVLRNVRYIV